MYKSILAQRITYCNRQWYCCLCKSPQSDLKKAKHHFLEAHSEQKNIMDQILSFLDKSNKVTEELCSEILLNGIILKNLPHNYYCIICKCLLTTLNNVHKHIQLETHRMCKNIIVKWDKIGEQLDDFAEIQPTCVSVDQSTKSLSTNCKSVYDGIIPYDGQELLDYFCEICKCPIPTLEHVHAHLKGKKHQICKETMENDPKNDQKDLDRYTSDKSAKLPSTDHNKLMRDGIKLDKKLNTYFCEICKCPIPTLEHVHAHLKGKKHQACKETMENNPKNDQKDLDRYTSDKSAKLPSTDHNKLMHDGIKLDQKLNTYFCEICKCPILTLKHAFEHLKGKKHKTYKETTKKKPSPTKENSKNKNELNRNISNTISTSSSTYLSEKANTIETQTVICTMNTLNNALSDGLLMEDMDEIQIMQRIDNFNIPVTITNTNHQDIISLEDKDTTPDLYLSDDIRNEINRLIKPTTASGLKKIKLKNQTVLERYNILYRADYLLFEEIMFSCCKTKLDKIKEHLDFYIPSNDYIFCFLCNVKHSNDLQVWHGHIVSQNHTKLVRQSWTDKSRFLLNHLIYYDQSGKSVKCHACVKIIDGSWNSLQMHISEDLHETRSFNLKTQMKSQYNQLIMKISDPLWYVIQNFACVPCSRRFKQKVEFIEHLYKNHISVTTHKSNENFSFCKICGFLWYETSSTDNLYSAHCLTAMHRYFKQSKDLALKPLSKEVTKLLQNVDENVAALFKMSNDRSAELNVVRVITDLENTLLAHHPSVVKVHLYGSRYTGLALPNSDMDLFINFGDESTPVELIKVRGEDIEQCLRADNHIWKIEEILINTRTPIIILEHISTGMQCDISYLNGVSVENSELIRSLNEAYLPCRKLVLFLKKWMKLCYFVGSQEISNYALTWLVIFYLQVKHGMPSIASLIKKHNKSKIICGWQVGVGNNIVIDMPELSMHKLLLGFFKYYAEFDYVHFVVCPLLGDKRDKKLFTYLEEFMYPEDMQPYLDHIKQNKPEYFRVDSLLCVQDPFVLSYNITRAVPALTVKNFRHYCKESAKMLNKLFAK